MPNDETTNAPVTPTDAPPDAVAAPAAAPAPLATPEDLGGTTNQPDAGTAMAGDVAENAQKVKQIAAESTAPPPPGPHQRLFDMVQGLGIGLSALGNSLAGRGGGAKEVEETYAGIQRQKLEAQQARDASKNQRLQQQIQVGQTLEANFNNYQVLQSVPDLTANRHLAVKAAQVSIAGEEQKQTIERGDYALSHGLMGPDEFNKMITSDTPLSSAPQTQGNYWIRQQAENTLDAGKKVLGSGDAPDAAVASLDKVLQDPNASAKSIWAAKNAVEVRSQTLGNAAKLQGELATSASQRIKADQEQLAQGTYNRTVPRNAAGQPTEDFTTWQARTTKEAEVAAQQGDPTTLGTMAADGLITIPQIAIARQLDKKGFQQVLAGADAEAKKNGAPEIIINGRPTGHYFNANAATLQYDYIKQFNDPNSKTQQTIQANNKFIEHAADLMAVNEKYGRTNEKFLNTPLNKIADAFGSTQYTELLAALTPVKNEYDNALKAGFAPTAEDQKAVDQLMATNSTPGQLAQAAQTMVHSIVRQMGAVNQSYLTHTGTNYPNTLTPDAAKALQVLGVDSEGLASGGSFSGTPQITNPGKTTSSSGKGVSLRAAMALPVNKGKTEAQVRDDITSHGHAVTP